MQIDKGRFGEVSLDGLTWGVLVSWPGAIHMGNGTFQSIVDARADGKQRVRDAMVTSEMPTLHSSSTSVGRIVR